MIWRNSLTFSNGRHKVHGKPLKIIVLGEILINAVKINNLQMSIIINLHKYTFLKFLNFIVVQQHKTRRKRLYKKDMHF